MPVTTYRVSTPQTPTSPSHFSVSFLPLKLSSLSLLHLSLRNAHLTPILTLTRPDIEYPINFLCRYQEDPRDKHLMRVLDILGYLTKMTTNCLHYPINRSGVKPTLQLSVKVDESNSDCPETRRSTFGYIIYLDLMPIHWKSKRTPFVTAGVGTTAYVALHFAAKGVLFTSYILDFLGFLQPSPIRMFTDNQSCSLAIQSEITTPLTRCLEEKYFYIRELHHNKKVNVKWIPRSTNESDLLTHPLPHTKLTSQRARLMT